MTAVRLFRGRARLVLPLFGRASNTERFHFSQHGFRAISLAAQPRFGKAKPRPAFQIVSGSGGLGILRKGANDLGHDAADLRRSVELALALATLAVEVPHQVTVGVAQGIVAFGTVLQEIKRGILKDGNYVSDPLHFGKPIAMLVRVVEIGEVPTGEALIGINQWQDDLAILIPLIRTLEQVTNAPNEIG
jgi:hypothetical protein